MTVLQDDRDKIVEMHADTVWRVALSRTGRDDAAQEVFQDVFLRYFQQERVFENEEHRKAWLIRTTLVCCRRYLSSYFGSRSLSLDEIGDISAETPDEEMLELYDALFTIPAKYRLPLLLYYIEDLPTETCVQVLKLKPNTFYSRLSRGKQLLRKALKGEDYFV